MSHLEILSLQRNLLKCVQVTRKRQENLVYVFAEVNAGVIWTRKSGDAFVPFLQTQLSLPTPLCIFTVPWISASGALPILCDIRASVTSPWGPHICASLDLSVQLCRLGTQVWLWPMKYQRHSVVCTAWVMCTLALASCAALICCEMSTFQGATAPLIWLSG